MSTSQACSSIASSCRRAGSALLIALLALGCGDDDQGVLEPDQLPPEIRVRAADVTEGTLEVELVLVDRSEITEVAYRVGDGDEVEVAVPEEGDVVRFTVEDVPFGETRVSVRAVDASGNEGTTDFTVTRPDETPPSVELLSPEGRAFLQADSVILEARITDGNRLEEAVLSAGERAPDTLELQGEEDRVERSIRLGQGRHTITLSVRDAAGNRRRVRTTVTLDTSAPALEVFNLADGDAVQPDSVPVTGSAVDVGGLRDVSVQVDGSAKTTLDAGGAADFPFEFSLRDLPEGEIELLVSARDRAGNVAEVPLTLVGDADGPTIEQLDAPEGGSVAADTFAVSLTASDADGVDRITYRVGDGEVVTVFEAGDGSTASVLAADGSTYRFVVRGLEPGENTVEIVVYDDAGNATRREFEVTVNLTAPRVLITAPQPADTIPAGEVTVAGTAEDPTGLTRLLYRLDDGPERSMPLSGSSERFEFVLEDVAAGGHVVRVTAVDAAGEESDAAAGFLAVTQADLGIDGGGVDTAFVGDTVDYALTVQNAGPGSARSTIVRDTLPSSLSPAGSSTSVGSCTVNGQIFLCDLGDVAAGDGGSVTLRAVASSAATATHAAHVASSTPDPAPGDNEASLTTVIRAAPSPDTADLSLGQTSTPDTAFVGDTVDLALTAGNGGPDEDGSVTVRDTLPGFLSFLSADGASCTASGGAVSCPLGALPAGGDTTVTLHARADAPGDDTASAVVSGAATDPVGANDRAGARVVGRAGGPTPQSVSIGAPAQGAVVTGASVSVTGRATDDQSVERLTTELNGGAETDASITPSDTVDFSVPVTLAPGTNTLVVRAYDQAGRTGADTSNFEYAQPPAASFTSSGGAAAGDPVSFDATGSSDPQGRPLTYYWEFGDGDVGATPTVGHVYAASGSYTVRLIVTNDAGLPDTTTTSLSISSPPPPARSDGVVIASVKDGTGADLSGVDVAETGGGPSGTTGSGGQVTLTSVPVGPPVYLQFTKSGYIPKTRSVQIPANADTARIDARLVQRAAPVTIPNAENGGQASGSDGTEIALDSGSLVDPNGDPVTGDVDASLTPIDVSGSNAAAFPGDFAGVDSAGNSTGLVSYGVADFTLTQGGQTLDLAPGETATVRIPVYTSGTSAGESIGLWTVDESTGQWVQEGSGTIVSDAASPTGLVMEATVGHLSPKNIDSPNDFWTPDVICQDGGGNGVSSCAIEATTTSGPAARTYGTVGAAGSTVRIPGGLAVRVSAGGPGGIKTGDTTFVAPAAGTGGTLTVQVRAPAPPASDTLSYGDTLTTAIDPAMETDRWALPASVGDVARVFLLRPAGSTLAGDFRVMAPNGDTIREVTNFTFGGFGTGDEEFVFPMNQSGNYTVEVVGTSSSPQAYELHARTLPTISLGSIVSDSLPSGGTMSWVFQGSQGDSVNVGVFYGENDFSSFISLQDTTGNVLFSSDAFISAPTELELQFQDPVLPYDGRYVVTFSASGGASGSFDLGVGRFQNTVPLGFSSHGSATERAVHRDTLAFHGAHDYYTFQLDADEGYRVRLRQVAGQDTLNEGFMEVFRLGAGDRWSPVDELKGSISFGYRVDQYDEYQDRAGQTDTYLVEVSDLGSDVGSYELEVVRSESRASHVVDDDLAQCPSATSRDLASALQSIESGGTVTVCEGTYESHEAFEPAVDSVTIEGQSGTPRSNIVLRRVGGGTDGPALLLEGSQYTVRNLRLESQETQGFDEFTGIDLLRPNPGSPGRVLLEDLRLTPVAGASSGGADLTGETENLVMRRVRLTGIVEVGEVADSLVMENDTVEGGAVSSGQVDLDSRTTAGVTLRGNQFPDRVSVLSDGTGSGPVVIEDNVIGGVLDVDAEFADSLRIRDNVITRGPSLNPGIDAVIERNEMDLQGTQMFVRAFVSGSPSLTIQNNVIRNGQAEELISIDEAETFGSVNIFHNSFRATASTFSRPTMIELTLEQSSFTGALPVTIVNNVMDSDPGESDDIGVALPSGTTVDSDYNLFYEVANPYDGGTTSTGSNDITGQDPLYQNDLLELGSGSPGIDAAALPASYPDLPDIDFDGDSRPGSGRDIGAHNNANN